MDPDAKKRTGFLRLDMNEGVPGLPDGFVEGIIKNITPEYLATYPEYKVLREKIAFHNGLKPENITLTNGSNGAIKHVFDAYISAHERVLIADPTFAMYSIYCKMLNAEMLSVEYNADLSFPVEKFTDMMSSRIKLAVLVNPNNPTGTALDHKTLMAIVKKAFENNILIIVDEAYFYFYPQTVIKEINKFENLIVLRTFSKLCGMAALRLGYSASCPSIADNLKKVKPTYDVNRVAVLFGEKLLGSPEIIENLIRAANEGKKYLTGQLSKNNIEYKSGQANFVLIKCGQKVKPVIDSLKEKKILVSGGFKEPFLRNYIRVTTGNKNVMEIFWKAFCNIWDEKNDA